MPLSEAEARPISIQMRVTELQVGDQVGPSDVTQAITYTVIGVPERTFEQRRDPVALLIRTPGGVESTLNATATTRVFVRRWVTSVQSIRAVDGSTDRVAPVVMLRSTLSGTLTIVDAGALRLQARDSVSFTAA